MALLHEFPSILEDARSAVLSRLRQEEDPLLAEVEALQLSGSRMQVHEIGNGREGYKDSRGSRRAQHNGVVREEAFREEGIRNVGKVGEEAT